MRTVAELFKRPEGGGTHERRRPQWIPIKAFAIAIVIGTILLMPPFSSSAGRWTDPLTALFTATSATCVTGLIVVDTGAYFSPFGRTVLLCLMQVGGLGIMTMGTFLLILIGRRLTVRDEFVLMDSLGAKQVRGLKSLLVYTLLFSILFELAGAGFLAWRLVSEHGYALGHGVYVALFHAVSAFCNAGFSLFSDSLTGFRDDWVIMVTVIVLIVVGGLGFLVLYNVSRVQWWRRNRLARGKLALHTKMVLTATFVLLVVGWVGFLALEWQGTLAPMCRKDKLLAALFQAVSPRTAGFHVVDMGAVKPATRYLTMIGMFIGGSPASTAGGIKTTTILVIIVTVGAMIRGREETELFGRCVSMRVVREALSIFILGVTCVMVFFGILLVSEHVGLAAEGGMAVDELLFETISAAGTVGLSTGITAGLSVVGKLSVIACMYIGRLGPMTIALMIGGRDVARAIRYPEEEVVVG